VAEHVGGLTEEGEPHPRDIERFTELSGDRNPIHYDAEAAAATPFGGIVVQGGVTTAILNAVVAEDLPGPGSVFLQLDLRFLAPVRPGDTITGPVVVTSVREDKPITELDVQVTATTAPSRSRAPPSATRCRCPQRVTDAGSPGRWRALAWLAIAEFLAMSTWFSASAVVLELREVWRCRPRPRVDAHHRRAARVRRRGAVLSAALSLADRFPPRRVMAVGALGAAAVNAGLLLVGSAGPAIGCAS
jgi:acyl dehydratase